jgi:hypothetical protein
MSQKLDHGLKPLVDLLPLPLVGWTRVHGHWPDSSHRSSKLAGLGWLMCLIEQQAFAAQSLAVIRELS